MCVEYISVVECTEYDLVVKYTDKNDLDKVCRSVSLI